MKRRSLLVVVALLCLASLMAAMAFTSATIINAAELKISTTDRSLISLEANTPWSWQDTTGAKDRTVVVKDGELFIQLGKGIDRNPSAPYFWGLQPNSEYQWNPLFTLRNKSAEKVKITLSVTEDLKQYITFGTCGQSNTLNPTWGVQGENFVIDNVPPETGSGMQNIRNICVKVNIPSIANFTPEQINASIVVDAVAIK